MTNPKRFRREKETHMKARMSNPAMSVPGVMSALQALSKAASHSALPKATIGLVTLRASQINGCSVCVEMHTRDLKSAGESDERIFTVAAWRESPYFDDAERAALALSEAATRLADRPDPVPDDVFDEAAKHFDDESLAALIVQIALINTWNRLNVVTRQIGGAWTGSVAEAPAS
jgi:AhpD family alkylhydroperoxidase